MSIEVVWTVAAVVVGLQLAAASWRVQREIAMSERGELVWLPPAEWMNLVALLVIIGGVFVLPVLGVSEAASLARHSLALGLVLLAGYPFALAGHYGLMNRGTVPSVGAPPEHQTWASRQETVAVTVTMLCAALYILVAVAS